MRRAILTVGLLACALAHAGMPPATVNLHLDVMREYPTQGRPAVEQRARCEDVASEARYIYPMRFSGIPLTDVHGLMDDMMRNGKNDAKRTRYVKAIATYVYAQPPVAASTKRTEGAQALYDMTLTNCRLELER